MTPFFQKVCNHLIWRREYFTRYLLDLPAHLRHIVSEYYYRTTMLAQYGLPTTELLLPNTTENDIAPIIMDDICMPPHYYVDDHDDITPLMKLLHLLQPAIILELGTAHGNTTANICQCCPSTIVYTVNAPVEEQTGDIITFALTRAEIGRIYRSFNFQERVIQIFENTLSMNLSHYLQKDSVDIAIIDACHDTSYVLNDFFKVQPFIKPNGIVLFHDTHPSMVKHLMGSYVACMKLRQMGFDIHHIKDTWWGVWVNGKQPLSSLICQQEYAQ